MKKFENQTIKGKQEKENLQNPEEHNLTKIITAH